MKIAGSEVRLTINEIAEKNLISIECTAESSYKQMPKVITMILYPQSMKEIM